MKRSNPNSNKELKEKEEKDAKEESKTQKLNFSNSVKSNHMKL